MKILHVDASARIDGSNSRALSRHFVETLRSRAPALKVDRLDLATHPPRHFGALETAAVSMPEADHTPAMRDAIADSDAIVARVLAADALVIGTPIYNFGMPSTLKAFFDHVSRNGKTFVADETGMRGLLGDKKAVVLMAAGGAYGPGEMFDGLDALTPHIRAILNFLGVADVTAISAWPLMFAGAEAANAAMSAAVREAKALANAWTR
ncbi:FMN-dependent NADH-azoreductase [Brevundimonas sp.]|jgi:FMN-dependent NADH-azoreductase|uniref:FMN-dependent NADH-azoreductase n=1 Tax=Brevundimonas sp. TaxID=1871086 RepID=UPI002E15AB09|nr:NAD(P)H-dependent oxidoreductase [Brevundimonas sp.]